MEVIEDEESRRQDMEGDVDDGSELDGRVAVSAVQGLLHLRNISTTAHNTSTTNNSLKSGVSSGAQAQLQQPASFNTPNVPPQQTLHTPQSTSYNINGGSHHSNNNDYAHCGRVCEGRRGPELKHVLEASAVHFLHNTPGLRWELHDHEGLVCETTGNANDPFRLFSKDCAHVTGVEHPHAWPKAVKEVQRVKKKPLGDACALCTKQFKNVNVKRTSYVQLAERVEQPVDSPEFGDLVFNATQVWVKRMPRAALDTLAWKLCLWARYKFFGQTVSGEEGLDNAPSPAQNVKQAGNEGQEEDGEDAASEINCEEGSAEEEGHDMDVVVDNENAECDENEEYVPRILSPAHQALYASLSGSTASARSTPVDTPAASHVSSTVHAADDVVSAVPVDVSANQLHPLLSADLTRLVQDQRAGRIADLYAPTRTTVSTARASARVETGRRGEGAAVPEPDATSAPPVAAPYNRHFPAFTLPPWIAEEVKCRREEAVKSDRSGEGAERAANFVSVRLPWLLEMLSDSWKEINALTTEYMDLLDVTQRMKQIN